MMGRNENSVPWSCVIALSCVLVVGCASGVHIHNNAEAQRARRALETYEKMDLGSITRIGIDNVTALNEVETETHNKLARLGFQIELSEIIGSTPKPSTEEGQLAQGWLRLVEETDSALKSLGSSLDTPKPDIESSLMHFEENTRDLEHEIRVFESTASDFRTGYPDSPLETNWKKVVRDDAKLTALFAKHKTPEQQQEDYREWVVDPAHLVHEISDKVKAGSVSAPEELRNEIAALEKSLKERKSQTRKLTAAFKAAKNALAEAEKSLALAEEQKDTKVIDAMRVKAKEKINGAVEEMGKVFKKGANIPVLGERLNVSVLMDLTSRLDDLKGAEDSPGYKVATSLLEILRTDPEMSERLGLGSVPPINALILELALHRMKYEQARARQNYEDADLRFLKLIRSTYTEEARAYVWTAASIREKRKREAEAVAAQRLSQAQLNTLRESPIDAYFNGKATAEMKAAVVRALTAYGVAQTRGFDQRRGIDIERRALVRRNGLEMSRISLTAWNALLRAPLDEIVRYHEGGITSREVADALFAIGLGAIAVGVN
jgi:uncharacterized coiled-coil DUF342 family protein